MAIPLVLLAENSNMEEASKFFASKVDLRCAPTFGLAGQGCRLRNFNGIILDCYYPSDCNETMIDYLGRDFVESRINDYLANEGISGQRASDLTKQLKDEVRKNSPAGLYHAIDAEGMGTPFVLTANHYLTNGIVENYCNELGWDFVFCPKDDPNGKSSPDYWQRVYDVLLKKMQGGKR